MNPLTQALNEYAAFHQNKTNRLLHCIGIPLVVFSVIIALNWFAITFAGQHCITLSLIAAALVSGYYISLDCKRSLIPSFILIVATFALSLLAGKKPSSLTLYLFLAAFISGWCLLLIGHAIEKNKPAFADNLTHLLIGPLYLILKLIAFAQSKRAKNRPNEETDPTNHQP